MAACDGCVGLAVSGGEWESDPSEGEAGDAERVEAVERAMGAVPCECEAERVLAMRRLDTSEATWCPLDAWRRFAMWRLPAGLSSLTS